MRWFISLTLRLCATSYSDTMVSSSKHYPKSIDRNKYTKVWITPKTTVINSTQANRGWHDSASAFPKKESKACQMPRVSSNLSQPPWNANVWQSSFSQSLKKSTWWNGCFPTSLWLLQRSLFQQCKSLGLTLRPHLSFWGKKATLHGWLADDLTDIPAFPWAGAVWQLPNDSDPCFSMFRWSFSPVAASI